MLLGPILSGRALFISDASSSYAVFSPPGWDKDVASYSASAQLISKKGKMTEKGIEIREKKKGEREKKNSNTS